MTEIPSRIVIVGAGHAAGNLIAVLKQQGYDGSIVLLGEEPYLPYQRPPLSKKFLAGELPAGRLALKPPEFYDEPNIDVRLDTVVTGVDRSRKIVTTAGGGEFGYDALVLATGARVNRLDCPGCNLGGLHYLRTIDDVRAIRKEFDKGVRAVIVGGGYIGLEVAAVLREAGSDVTVLEVADRVMSRVVSPEVSDFFNRLHTSRGVDLRVSTALAGFHGDNRVKSVETHRGIDINADIVIIGIGIIPNAELAAQAGLAVDNGIVVDDHCRTSDASIYAIGDCTSHPSRIYARNHRLESVQNALEQARTAARNLCGEDTTYDEVPWFWSDQYEYKLQIAGISVGYDDTVVRGNPEDGSFSCVYLRDGVFIAIDCVNAPKDFMLAKTLIAAGRKIDTSLLADTSVTFRDMLRG